MKVAHISEEREWSHALHAHSSQIDDEKHTHMPERIGRYIPPLSIFLVRFLFTQSVGTVHHGEPNAYQGRSSPPHQR